MSRDFRSFPGFLVFICVSCVVLSSFSTKAIAYVPQEKETEELIEELKEQLEGEADEQPEKSQEKESDQQNDVEGGGDEESKPQEDSSDEDSSSEETEGSDQQGKTEEPESTKPKGSDASQETTEGAADDKATDEDEGVGMVLPSSGEKEALTSKNIQWIWNLLFLFLTICFLGWLLSLMTRKPEEATVESGSASLDSDGTAKKNDLDFGKVYAARPSTVDDLTKIGGIDAAAEKRLNAAGIWQYDQLRKMTAQQRANLQRKLNLPRIRWYSLSGLGGEGGSTSNDGSTGKTGVAAATAAAAGAAAAATASLAATSNDKAKSSSSSTAQSSSNDGSFQRIDSELGNVYVRPPKFRDDLTRLEEVDAKTAAEMNANGIYSFKQIESLSPVQRLAFEKRFGVSIEKLNLAAAQKSSVVSGQGGSAPKQGGAATVSGGTTSGTDSGGNTSNGSGSSTSGSAADAKPSDAMSGNKTSSEASTSSSAKADNGSSAKKTTAGGTISKDTEPASGTSSRESTSKANTVTGFAATNTPSATSPNGGKVVPGSGSNGSKSPRTGQGDSTSNGIGKSAAAVAGAAAVGATGVAGAAKSATASASASISLSDLVSAGKGRMDDTLGFVYTSPPADPDDLTKLVGIDADAAKRLNAAGIYKFDQLNSLDESQTAALARRFRLPDADFSDWRRCFYAWSRGIATTAEADEVYGAGMLHGIELPKIANGIFDGDKLVAYPEQTIFRGSNPEGWGRGNIDGIEGVETSISCDSIRSDINYLRIRRTDTRESVVVPMTKGNIFSNGGDNENGWNGSSEVFFGGRHIGAFAQHLPQEVETKFSQGGWGFGHRYDHNDRQEWGWGGRVIEPTTFEVSVGCIGEVPGTVVFRSSDPSIWNTRTREGESRYADPVSSVNHPVNFVRIMRQATGEAVIVRVDGKHILDEGFDPRCGWNGSGSDFSGGMHLGAYHSDLPQDFETRFEFGGWGFGHPYDDNDRQSWGWAGRQLPETVFEISLLESVPEFMKHELVE